MINLVIYFLFILVNKTCNLSSPCNHITILNFTEGKRLYVYMAIENCMDYMDTSFCARVLVLVVDVGCKLPAPVLWFGPGGRGPPPSAVDSNTRTWNAEQLYYSNVVIAYPLVWSGRSRSRRRIHPLAPFHHVRIGVITIKHNQRLLYCLGIASWFWYYHPSLATLYISIWDQE